MRIRIWDEEQKKRSKWETEQDLTLNGEQRGSDKGDRHRAKNVRQRVLDILE